jgi:hypothetical protein
MKQNETEHLLSTEANRNRLLEDAAERLYPDCSNVLRQMAKETFIEGAKWQQERSYSEEDMLNFAWFLIKNVGQYSDDRMAHFEGKYLDIIKTKIICGKFME